MEKEELNMPDPFGELIRQTPLDSPSEDFIDRVMAVVQSENAVVEEKTNLWDYIRAGLPYAALIVFCLFIFLTSDLPGLKNLPGQGLLTGQFMTCCISLVSSLKDIFTSGYITWGVLIGVAGGVIYFVDQAFSRKASY